VRILGLLSGFFEKIARAISTVLMIVMFCLVFSGVVFRIIGNSFSLSEELSRWCLISLCFIGGSVALKQKQHVGVNMLILSLPAKAAKPCIALAYLVVFVLLGFATYYSFTAAVAAIDMTGDIVPVSMMYVKFSLPFGMFMMIVHLLHSFAGVFRAKNIESILIGS